MRKGKALVKNKSHMRPMVAVLKRYKIGRADQYGRGVWITIKDLPDIIDRMDNDKTAIKYPTETFVQGTNQHNYVSTEDFYKLFEGEQE